MVSEVSRERLFAGCWRILEVYGWSSDYLNLVTKAHFTFDGDDGEFALGEIEGSLDVHYDLRGDSHCAEFSWDGHDMGAVANGRGWLAIIRGSRGFGHFYVHKGDNFAFVCKRKRRS